MAATPPPGPQNLSQSVEVAFDFEPTAPDPFELGSISREHPAPRPEATRPVAEERRLRNVGTPSKPQSQPATATCNDATKPVRTKIVATLAAEIIEPHQTIDELARQIETQPNCESPTVRLDLPA